jgi:hypothetical protein
VEKPNAVNGNAGAGVHLRLMPRLLRRAVSAGVSGPARRDNAAAGDLPNPRIRPLRIKSHAFPASFFALASTVHPTDLLDAGKWTSLFRLVSQGIVVFLFNPRKDALPLSHRP